LGKMRVQLYICPTPGCPSYYGHDNMPDLAGSMTGPKTEDREALRQATGSPWRHNRAACPTCRLRGVEVDRVLVEMEVPKPVPVA
jgi:hypothetical protein